MRDREVAYWDGVAKAVTAENGVSDNWLKRGYLGQFLLKCSWSRQTVLEIGVGNGVTAAMLALSCGRLWDYTGTELAPQFIENATRFGLKVVQADVLSLPAGPFTRILALDSLEHVRPEDRPAGYDAIAERLVPGGLLFINMPIDRSLHEDEFDHGIGIPDILELERRGLSLVRYERYDIQYAAYKRAYAFVTMTKEPRCRS